ncbi:ketoacyl-ACP synthase III [Candidatus Bipolaricaulota bacterium]|nr:ketoacyl-ACP synthase III [Candidatus Bipolaricaulota bacterium]
MGVRIAGTGSHLPARIVTNDQLATWVDTSDEWIVQRTGIQSRHLLEASEIPSDMGVDAGKKALEAAHVLPEQVDLLLVATNFPDLICPGTAPFVADGLGLDSAPFFDLKAGCSGFVYGVAVANGLIESGLFPRILVIGIEALSRVTDWSDRRTCVLFGDGAGAALLEKATGPSAILGSALYGDASKSMFLNLPAGGTRLPASAETVAQGAHFLKMEGSGVFRNAAPMMETATLAALADAGLTLADVDWIIPHQANQRIIGALVRKLDVSADRVIVNLDRVANTSTASIPIALDEEIRSGKIQPGDVIVMTAFGAGVTYGAIVVRI